MKIAFFLVGLIFLSFACTSVRPESSNRPVEVKLRRIEFSDLSKLKPGVDDRFTVIQKFGEPNSKENTTSLPLMEFWTYDDARGPLALRMVFFPDTGKLRSVAYYLDESSELANKEVLFEKYLPGVKLKEITPKVKPGQHTYHPERYFSDESIGVTIETDGTGKKIQDITFFEPKTNQKRIVGSEKKR